MELPGVGHCIRYMVLERAYGLWTKGLDGRSRKGFTIRRAPLVTELRVPRMFIGLKTF